MIFHYKSNIDFKVQVNNVLNNIDEQLNIQIGKKKTLLNCLESLNSPLLANISDNEINLKLSTLLQSINNVINMVIKNISDLEKLKSFFNNLDFPDKSNFPNKKLLNTLKEYNKLATSCKNNIYNSSITVDNIILNYTENLKSIIDEYLSITPKSLGLLQPNTTTSVKDDANKKTLIISEIKNKVILPYTISDLEYILSNNPNYNNIQDVIDNEYTIPLSEYKNPRLSRFKETFNLMRKKEKSSIADSLDLALELSFNTLLNPAIIAACKNLDELDIYLDCLSSNELDKFKFFQIKYEIPPKIVRKKIQKIARIPLAIFFLIFHILFSFHVWKFFFFLFHLKLCKLYI